MSGNISGSQDLAGREGYYWAAILLNILHEQDSLQHKEASVFLCAKAEKL